MDKSTTNHNPRTVIFQGTELRVLRPAHGGDKGFDKEGDDQVVVKHGDGSERVVPADGDGSEINTPSVGPIPAGMGGGMDTRSNITSGSFPPHNVGAPVATPEQIKAAEDAAARVGMDPRITSGSFPPSIQPPAGPEGEQIERERIKEQVGDTDPNDVTGNFKSTAATRTPTHTRPSAKPSTKSTRGRFSK